jgi:hypothetical protein
MNHEVVSQLIIVITANLEGLRGMIPSSMSMVRDLGTDRSKTIIIGKDPIVCGRMNPAHILLALEDESGREILEDLGRCCRSKLPGDISTEMVCENCNTIITETSKTGACLAMEVIQNNKSCSVITLIDFNALRQII